MVATLDQWVLQNFCVVIPAFNEERFVGKVVSHICELGVDVLVVDDGSADETARVAEEAGARVLRLEKNHGKGGALNLAFKKVLEEGYDAVVTMDADGQHDPEDVLRFCDVYNRTGIPVLIGNRMGDRKNMPWVRRVTNRFMSWLLRRHMRQYIADTQNGFRLYQTDVISMVSADSTGFAAESEILLKLDEVNIRMGSVPVAARYGDEKSSIHPLKDTRHFFRMLRQYSRKKRSDGRMKEGVIS